MTIKYLMHVSKVVFFSSLSFVMIVGGIVASILSGTSSVNAMALPFFKPRTLLSVDYHKLCSDASWREPMDLHLRPPRYPPTPGRKIRWNVAESRIRSVLARQHGVRFGLIVKDLSTGDKIEINSNARFASASLVKIPVLIGLYKDMADGRINPLSGPLFAERHRVGGSGYLKSEHSGVKVNLRDLCYMMLQKSDNIAANILTELVGEIRVTRMCTDMGWCNTDMVRPVMALDLRRRGIENWTTPHEMADMLESMYRGRVVSKAASEEMIILMLNPPIDDRLARYLPVDIDIAHKTGLIENDAHDVGIIYLPNHQAVLVAAFADKFGSNYRAAKIPVANVARILYEEATAPSSFEPGRRRN